MSTEQTPLLTVLVVNYNTAGLIGEMMQGLRKGLGELPHRLVIVDNASRDDSLDRIREHCPQAQLFVNPSNIGFGRANNLALSAFQGRYLLLANTDAFLSEGVVERSIAYMEAHPACGIVGTRLIGRDEAVQPSCRFFPSPFNLFLQRAGLYRLFPKVQLIDDRDWDDSATQPCDWVPGCYYLVRREVIEAVGLFDPRYFLYFEEVDHCRRAKAAGWQVVYHPCGDVIHIGGESAKSEGELTATGRQVSTLQLESELLYLRCHFGLAGVLTHLFLHTAGTCFIGVKHLLKRRPGRLRELRDETRLLWSSVFATRGGTQPTR